MTAYFENFPINSNYNFRNLFQIFLHTEADELTKYIPKEMLPTEYGGNAGSMNDLHGKYDKGKFSNKKLRRLVGLGIKSEIAVLFITHQTPANN